jgi:type IV pilus assembly protein PilY1
VFFTTFKPTSDVCKFGGDSYVWGTTYDTGGTLPDAALKGKALVQVSTGSFEEVDLKAALTASFNRKMGSAMTGKPPAPPPPVISNSDLKPVKRIIHIQER